MLVLSRKLGEKIVIGESIVLTVVAIDGPKIRLGIEAPSQVRVDRAEVRERMQASQVLQASTAPALATT